MHESEEFPFATGPMRSSYSPGEEQTGNLIHSIGPELYQSLERAGRDPGYKQRWIEEIRKDD